MKNFVCSGSSSVFGFVFGFEQGSRSSAAVLSEGSDGLIRFVGDGDEESSAPSNGGLR
jgi:hypothetical protein